MRRALPLIVAAVVLAACAREDDGMADRYDELFERQMRDYERQTQIFDQLLKVYMEQADRYDALLRRWQAQTDRYEKILDAMEKAIPK